LISTEFGLSNPNPFPCHVKRVKIFASVVTPDIVSTIMVFLTSRRYLILYAKYVYKATMTAVYFAEINKAEREA
jgi:ABC-type siderophore export system fused ATPase/permease subunit